MDDVIHGPITFDSSELDDLIIVRSDGNPTYNFCVVVDDMDMKVTHVIRGEDVTADVALSVDAPDGFEATLSTPVVGPDATTAALTVVVPPALATGTYTLWVNGAIGSVTRTIAVIARAMSRERGARFPDMRALGAALLPFATPDVARHWERDFAPSAVPAALPIDNRALPLNYAYKPGQADDGVTLNVSVREAEALTPAALAAPTLRSANSLHKESA